MIHRLDMPMPGMLGTVNCYLVVNGSRAALIDTGMASERNIAAMKRALARFGHTVSSLEKVICTHYHPDHAGFGKFFQDAGTEVFMSRQDSNELTRWQADSNFDDDLVAFGGEHDVPADFLASVSPVFAYLRTLQQRFAPSALDDNDNGIDIAGVPFEIIYTPGHTDGHIGLFQRETCVVISGDHILAQSAVNIVLKHQSQYDAPLAQYLLSLEKISSLGAALALTGHGEPIQDVRSRCVELSALHQRRLVKVKEALRQSPLTAYELSTLAFGEKRRSFSKWLGMAQTISYLEYLMQKGEVTCGWFGNRKTFSRVG